MNKMESCTAKAKNKLLLHTKLSMDLTNMAFNERHNLYHTMSFTQSTKPGRTKYTGEGLTTSAG